MLGRYEPGGGDGPAPTAWGEPAHVQELLGAGLTSLHTERRQVRLDFTGTPAELRDYYRTWFAPVIATVAGQGEDTERVAALDRDLLQFFEAENTGPVGGPGHYEYEYLLVVASPG